MIIEKDILQLKFFLGLGLHSVTIRREGKKSVMPITYVKYKITTETLRE